MKLQKGDKAVVLDTAVIPGSLVGQRVKIIGVLEDSKTYWCKTKQGRFWINESGLESVKVHKRKERIRRKIEVLQAKIRAL